MIIEICEMLDCPTNVMRLPEMVSNAQLAELGVARISYGGSPWYDAMAKVQDAARETTAGITD